MSSLPAHKIEGLAREVLETNGFTAPPICPFSIALKQNILLMAKDSREEGVSGWLMRFGNSFGIAYANHIKNEGFKRFTVAHELGHYFLPGHAQALFSRGQDLHLSNSGFVSSDLYEREADNFAAALLMPAQLFVEAMERFDSYEGLRRIQELSKIFVTSITATAHRLAYLTEEAVAVVMSQDNEILSCFVSQRLRNVVGSGYQLKGRSLTRRTPTARFNRRARSFPNSSERDRGPSTLGDWFSDAPRVEIQEDVVGLGHSGMTLTVLFAPS